MLTTIEYWYATDRGRQRQDNEDDFFVGAPLFAVADGMGGAQAGEVASALAVKTLAEGVRADLSPARALVDVIQLANSRIYELSRSEHGHTGMGTTVTAVYVAAEAVVVAHVGDSRAYLLRDGELERLTTDHSLVGELVARGKLTEEQAHSHPQRSVITRALGPEPNVAVDAETHQAQADDVFLVCSDGLTAMLSDQTLHHILTTYSPLAKAGEQLIAAANAAGGRDNITVVLFRLGENTEREDNESLKPGEAETRIQTQVDRSSNKTGRDDQLEGGVTRAALRTAQAKSKRRWRHGQRRVSARPLKTPRVRKRRGLVGLGVVLVTTAILLTAGWIATRAVYFVGTDANDQQTIAIFRGLPYRLPAGIKLYENYAESGATLEQVPLSRRSAFINHKLRSRNDAEGLIRALERGQLVQ